MKIDFILENCDASIATALRRIMLSEIPTLAIHEVQVYENTSCLPDEYIVHRLGLIPFTSERAISKILINNNLSNNNNNNNN